ncbi:alpha/beta hydrolase fold domain-containing protein [Mariniflexile gromovii]|uniref:Alpha/beta hydrolase fold domain-containing protein n=1 Tax=Mariniflexile gromovii TaxID=362523 RepID=A0ABS4BXU8_9FLAO|nr:alpha/beta hydrolase fold domain-containing protein [Mariniflexile gromovii]MBP0905416.1 alpha/beta hydrolase fold domain-containing protein [Mariniflexile gromovii]
MKPNQTRLNILIAAMIFMAPFFKTNAQSDDQSNGAYRKIYIQESWAKLDTNNDGVFTEKENELSWKKIKRFDSNQDNQVSFEEYSNKIQIPNLETDGKRKLNVLYKVTKEKDLYLDIYYPKNAKEGDKLPVVIYTHGGGWAAGSRHGASNASFKTVHTALLDKGFCVVSVSYRLWEKDGTTSMRDCVIDCKDALRYLSKNNQELSIDKNRFYAFGDSAGGQIAQMLLLSSPESLEGDGSLKNYDYKMVAGVSWYGPCDFEKSSLFNHDDRPDFRDRFGPRILMPDTKEKDKLALYREMSPINYLTKTSPPLLMIQGDSDTTIPVKHAYYMEEKAEKIGAPVSIIIVKNAGHNWRKVGADINPTRGEIEQSTIAYFVSNF